MKEETEFSVLTCISWVPHTAQLQEHSFIGTTPKQNSH